MTELEKIINGLEKAKMVIEQWIPMFEQYNTPTVIDETIAILKEQEDFGAELTNAVELIHKKNERIKKMLEEQESIEPICQIIFDVPYYFCGSCKAMLNMYAVKAKYCSQCGRQVKWK